MVRLATPSSFVRAVSMNPGLKLKLAWLSFSFLVLPSAILMSTGSSERYVLPAMSILIVPFQYAVFCVLESRRREVVDEYPAFLLSKSTDITVLMPPLISRPRLVHRYSVHLRTAQVSSHNGHPQTKITVQGQESLSAQGQTAQLGPSSQICYTKA